jgi:hypothetical protein
MEQIILDRLQLINLMWDYDLLIHVVEKHKVINRNFDVEQFQDALINLMKSGKIEIRKTDIFNYIVKL